MENPVPSDKAARSEATSAADDALTPSGISKPKHFWRNCTLSVCGLFFLLFVFCFWMLETNTGTRFFFHAAHTLGYSPLSLINIEGRLADHLEVDEVTYKDKEVDVKLRHVRLDWHPFSLFSSRVDISSLVVSTANVETVSSKTPMQLPGTLQLPIDIDAQHIAIGRVVIHQREAVVVSQEKSAKPESPKTFHGIVGSVQSRESEHKLKLSFDSEWGKLHANGKIQTKAPFLLTADVNYQGQIDGDIPSILVHGKLNGNLADLRITAQTVPSDVHTVDPSEKAIVDLELHVTPFQKQVLRLAKLDFDHINPTWFNPSAPSASLSGQIDLQPKNILALTTNANVSTKRSLKVDASRAKKLGQEIRSTIAKLGDIVATSPRKSPNNTDSSAAIKTEVIAMTGHWQVKNAKPLALDKGGIPLRQLRSSLDWHGDDVQFDDLKIDLLAGQIDGQGKLEVREKKAPIIDAKLSVRDVDLATIDTRIRSTKIKGNLQLQSKGERKLDFQAQLSDPRASIRTDATLQFNQQGQHELLTINSFEIQEDQQRVTGSAQLHFDGKQAFSLQTKMQNINPAHWSAAPGGHVDAEWSVTGSLLPKLQAQIKTPAITGELAGQKLTGVLQIEWLEDVSISTMHSDLQWGKNAFSAQGILGKDSDELKLNVNAEDLALLSQLGPLAASGNEKFKHFSMTGKAELSAVLRGKLNAVATSLKLSGSQLAIEGGAKIAQLDVTANLGADAQGAFDIDVVAQQVRLHAVEPESVDVGRTSVLPKKEQNLLERLQVATHGQRNTHSLSVRGQWNGDRVLQTVGTGGLDVSVPAAPIWRGRLEQMLMTGWLRSAANLNSGKNLPSQEKQAELRLLAPATIEIGRAKVSLNQAKLEGSLGKFRIDQLEWTPESIASSGALDGFPVLAALQAVEIVKAQDIVGGDLQIGAQWDFQFKDHLRGNLSLKRQRGDLTILDADGTQQAMSLGLGDVQVMVQTGGVLVGSDAERVHIDVNAVGSRFGRWKGSVDTQLSKIDSSWTLSSEAPMQGQLRADVPELQWLASQLSADLTLKGALKLDAVISGKLGHPKYKAQLEGHNLEFAFASEGLLFPNGELKAQLTDEKLKLEQFRFSNKIAFVPKVEQLQDLNWTGQEGEFTATGEVNWGTQKGQIQAIWKQFPLLQRKDRWLVVSGQAAITQTDQAWSLLGKLAADAAYIRLPKLPPPSLSGDVIVSRGVKIDQVDAEVDAGAWNLKKKLDMQIDLGKKFVFVGRGIDTLLNGTMRLRSSDGVNVAASGAISTVGGTYDGYGQQLEIERGILNFQGPWNNPSLNIRALRKGLAVEAGVDVTGTVARQQIRLVSEPNVTDNEKLSWLVFGREPDQGGTVDASTLLTAAGAVFAGDGTRNFPKEFAQVLGLDVFTMGPAENGGASKLPSQTVAGSTAVGSSSVDKVVTVGKTFKPGLVVSVERSLSDASNALKLSWQLSKRVRFVVRTGTDNSVDVRYRFSFN